jgi:hypothetical protein
MPLCGPFLLLLGKASRMCHGPIANLLFCALFPRISPYPNAAEQTAARSVAREGVEIFPILEPGASVTFLYDRDLLSGLFLRESSRVRRMVSLRSWGRRERLHFATFLGGNTWEIAAGIAVDRNGNATMAGSTFFQGFPVTATVPQRKSGGMVGASSRRCVATAMSSLPHTSVERVSITRVRLLSIAKASSPCGRHTIRGSFAAASAADFIQLVEIAAADRGLHDRVAGTTRCPLK